VASKTDMVFTKAQLSELGYLQLLTNNSDRN